MNTRRLSIIAAVIILVAIFALYYHSGQGTKATIKIGQMSGLTGVGSNIGVEERNGALLAVEEINAAGGISGMHLELISEDTPPFDAKKGASVAQKLIAIDHVAAIVGPQWDEQGEIMATISAQQKVPVVSQNVSTDIESEIGSPYFFETWPDDEVGIRAVLKYAQLRGWNRIAIVQPANFSFWLFTSNLFEKDAPEYGITVVAKQMGTDFGNADYRTLISKVKSAQPDAFFGTYENLECVFLKQAREQGMSIPLLSTDSALNIKAIEDCGNELQDRLYFSTLNRDNGFEQFASRYEARFGQKPLVSSAATSYNAVLVLADVMKKLVASGQEINRENIRAGLVTEKFEGGVSTRTIQFNEKGFVITGPDTFEMQTVKDEKFVKAE
ncbi:MAG TPA: ABC transporter substrate-binding protein [Candidatus Paceibacterota bacterium]